MLLAKALPSNSVFQPFPLSYSRTFLLLFSTLSFSTTLTFFPFLLENSNQQKMKKNKTKFYHQKIFSWPHIPFSCHPIFALIYTKISWKDCTYSLQFSISCSLGHTSIKILPPATVKLLLSGSPVTSISLNPIVNSELSL